MSITTGDRIPTMTNTTTAIAYTTSHDDYQSMLGAVRDKFATIKGPLFETEVEGRALWDAWLGALPASERQHHTCHGCRRFIERYGGLVTVDDGGVTRAVCSLMTPGIFQDAFEAVARLAKRARITGVHVSSETTWGLPSNPDKKRACTWNHMHAVPPASLLYRGIVKTASQHAAELGEDYATLARALAEFKVETVRAALQIAASETLYRGEKIEGRLRWLVDLYEKRADLRGPARENVLWLAVATAPAGFCHVRSSMVGSLLEDLEAGKPFDDVKRSFDAKMNPLQYQRPTAPPGEGNIKQAEEVVAKLGAVGALRRRFARLEDVQTIWTPAPVVERKADGVFGHLLAQNKDAPLVTSGPTTTWEKFARTVLPTAETIEVLAPGHDAYTALLTAADPTALPIIQWDREDARNSVSWYTYANGSPAQQWNLRGDTYVAVTAVSLMPNMWQAGGDHHGKGVIFLLAGCRDTRWENAGLGLFPEFLKTEFHAVRSTIEAHSRRGRLEEPDLATACGLTVRAGSNRGSTRVRVTSRGVVTSYTIDRWD